MTINQRIKNIRKDNNLNQIEFSMILDIKQATLSQIENDVIAPSLDIIKKIIGNFNISYEWLIDGIGSKIKKENNNTDHNKVSDTFKVYNKTDNNLLIDHTLNKIKDLEQQIVIEKQILEILKNQK